MTTSFEIAKLPNYRILKSPTPPFDSHAWFCLPNGMEARKDPITRSWVITGDDVPETAAPSATACSFCPDSREQLQIVSTLPSVDGGPWSARAVVHPIPLYRIEGEPSRRGDGLYDRMRPVGAHEVLLENPRHERQLWIASDSEIERFLFL